MKYKLDIARDVDRDGWSEDEISYILNLPKGFRFDDDLVHTRGYDTMKELKWSAKNEVIVCNCKECSNV